VDFDAANKIYFDLILETGSLLILV